MSFVFFLAVVLLIAFFGSLFMPGDWYVELRKPAWNPPSWVFGPVWSLLYLMMAIAAWLVWERRHRLSRRAVSWWLIQLLLNGVWSWFFFGLHRPGWALAEMTLLWICILVTIRLFRRIRKAAAILMLPYLAWVTFAWALNLAIWRLNGGGLNSVFG